jgi:methionyl-tRNA formyltransferase
VSPPASNAPTPLRIAILTYESLQSKLIVQTLLDTFPTAVTGILASEVAISGKEGRATAAWFLLRRTGLGFVGRKILEIWLSRIAAWRARVAPRPGNVPSLGEMATRAGVPLLGVMDVNGPETHARLAAWGPDLLVSANLNQRVAQRTMALARLGAINVHGALLPSYRGLFPYFWMLADGAAEAGVTVHWMDEHFDTGPVIMQERIAISDDDTVFSLSLKGASAGAHLVARAIISIADGSAQAVPQESGSGSYYSWPTPADVRRLRRRGRRYGSVREMWRAFRA